MTYVVSVWTRFSVTERNNILPEAFSSADRFDLIAGRGQARNKLQQWKRQDDHVSLLFSGDRKSCFFLQSSTSLACVVLR